MAYTSGTAGTALGALLTILDVDLVANAKWSVYDAAAGTNAKTYRCYDAAANVDFYVYVNDNIGTVYAEFQLWEGWDAVGHAGTGTSVQTVSDNAMLIRKDAGGYGMCVSDHRFIHIDFVKYIPTYIGQLERFDTSKNMPMSISTGDGVGAAYNPIGHIDSSTILGQWYCLFDENGTQRQLQPVSYTGTTGRVLDTIAGTYYLPEVGVYNPNSLHVMGTLEGVRGRNYTAASGLSNGDLITVDGIEWVALAGDETAHWCLVKKA